MRGGRPAALLQRRCGALNSLVMSDRAFTLVEDCEALLGPDEPEPFERVNEDGRAPALLLCDHASSFIPRAFDRLGLDEGCLARHIALDIGAADVTRRIALQLDTPAVLSRFSRLIVDPNRTLDAPSLIPEESDGIVVPGNRNLSAAAREARVRLFHQAYHGAVEQTLAQLMAREAARQPGRGPVVVSIHSFTPVMDGVERPWQVGVLWNRDPRMPQAVLAKLRALGLSVGDNEPYSGRHGHGYTLHSHAEPRGLANVLLELRQDLIDTHRGAAEWAALLADVLEEVMSDPDLFTIVHRP